ncbi:hypothetical protein NXS19_007014 [Fusarium pseudograminearum]|nr:hypothetical protein NXS19_007014 [Fusarium pseudograminearum]
MAAQIETDPALDLGNETDISAESDIESTASYANPKYGKHWAPNDEEQLEALDLIHHWLTLMLDDKLFLPRLAITRRKS